MKFLIEDLEKDLDQLLYKVYTGRDSIDRKIATMINTRRKYHDKPEIQKMINNYLTKLYDDKYGDKETISESSNQLKDMALFNKRKRKQTSLSTFFADPAKGIEHFNHIMGNDCNDCESNENVSTDVSTNVGGGLMEEKKKINIKEALNNIDKETMNTDLLNMYESCNLNNEEKAEIANLIIEEDIEGINSYLSKKLNEDDEGDYFNDDYDEDDSDFFDDEYEEPEFNELDSDWTEYYIYLEDLRQSGVTNMFGASPYLANEFNISERDARKVLADWMKNYNELSNKFGWRKGE